MMAYFNEHFYNPAYINPIYYQQMKNTIQQDQNERVMKAVHAFCDMLDQVDGMDPQHQEHLFGLCLAEMARRNRWG